MDSAVIVWLVSFVILVICLSYALLFEVLDFFPESFIENPSSLWLTGLVFVHKRLGSGWVFRGHVGHLLDRPLNTLFNALF